MDDLSDLREALAQHDDGEAGTHQYSEMAPIVRAYLAGRPIQWCETCDDKARPPCWNSVGTPIEGHGLIHPIVPVRLVY